ncbi:hydrogenase expression/formation protein HypE [Thermococcus kodakarensis KOD1]|uniref:Hydrogenase expression/formation protein HypE n=1 Tax=Thermococcus kodakarensis (strain ATCC BAA-918 / JCM 12380 / KOD1) TaxID=69014 RepID=Q5JIC2_THEKO|nr:AIR synthase family protein [Thermococcus kodakarensis]WCN28938.1 AIR synthase family protein [Thermococcus kodakarensis]WCN31242.1 AIR synthase family protein [Thermococcus kodakarensis]BAD85150.1 hydrogenase expression/formation protein HypE [Thermococcus kodakarensis KOD1]
MLPPGKLRNDILREVVFPNLGVEDSKVVYGPREGFDSAVLEYDDEHYLVVATDPTLGVPEETFGFFTYHFASSDVAVFGARPRWLVVDLLFPEGTSREFLEATMKDLNAECRKYGSAIVGGHTGVYPSISEPTATTTAMGIVRKGELKLPLAKPGDKIVVTAKVGLEFAVSAAYFRADELSKVLTKKELMRLKRSFYFETAVPDALVAKPFVRGMHDATEGGLTALHEIADNSGVGFRVYSDRLHIDPLVKKVLDFYDLKPWSVSSTGTLIAITPTEKVNSLITELLKNGILAFELGEFTEEKDRVLVEGEEERPFPEFTEDPYVRLYGKG